MTEQEEVIEEIFAEEEELTVKQASILSSLLELPQYTFQFITDYGWCLLAAIFVLYYLWNKYKPALLSWRERSINSEQSALNHEDAEIFIARQRAMDAARQRMQEEINQLSILERERMKEREEEKRRKKIEEWEKLQKGRTSGRRLNEEPSTSAGSKLNKKDGKGLREEYNPLMGSSGGACYRPSRRGGVGGGGG